MYSKSKSRPKASWTTTDLDSLAARLGKTKPTGSNGLFLNGKYPHRTVSQDPRQNQHVKTQDLKKKIKKSPQSKPQMLSDPKRHLLKIRGKGQKDSIQVPLPELKVLTVH